MKRLNSTLSVAFKKSARKARLKAQPFINRLIRLGGCGKDEEITALPL